MKLNKTRWFQEISFMMNSRVRPALFESISLLSKRLKKKVILSRETHFVCIGEITPLFLFKVLSSINEACERNVRFCWTRQDELIKLRNSLRCLK